MTSRKIVLYLHMKTENLQNWIDSRIATLEKKSKRKSTAKLTKDEKDQLLLRVSSGAQLTAYKQMKHWIDTHKLCENK